jgi:hypothetical protein
MEYKNEKDKQIVELLKEGKSFSQIKNILHVSPNKISTISKTYTIKNSTTDSDIITTTDNINSDKENNHNICSINSNENINKNDQNLALQNQTNETIMNNNYKYQHSIEKGKIDLEKIKLSNEHKINLEKIEIEKKALKLKEKELNLLENSQLIEKDKYQKKELTLIFKFQVHIKKYTDRIWTIQELEDYYNETESFIEIIKEHCFINNIESKNLKILSILLYLLNDIGKILENHDGKDQDYEINLSLESKDKKIINLF